MTEHPRTESARRNDDSDLLENADRAPSFSGASGGGIARDVGAADEEKRATGEAAGLTRVEKSKKVQPSNTGTRADFKGERGRDLAERT